MNDGAVLVISAPIVPSSLRRSGRFLFIAMVNNGIDQPKRTAAFDLATDHLFQDVVVDAGEIFLHIALHLERANSVSAKESAVFHR